jgi:hypothetical protein
VNEKTAGFLRALDRDLKSVERSIQGLDALWGKGIGANGAVDKQVLDQLRRRKEGLKVQAGALRRLANGEIEQR